jgi:hypothetical protein
MDTCLLSDEFPDPPDDCEHCGYVVEYDKTVKRSKPKPRPKQIYMVARADLMKQLSASLELEKNKGIRAIDGSLT